MICGLIEQSRRLIISTWGEMIMLAGYDIIAQIYKGRRSAIFRALRSRDQQQVTLKTPITDFPRAEHIARLRHEFALGSTLADPHVILYHALEDSPNGPFLVTEDFDAVALAHLLSTTAKNGIKY
jgi:hypothetical protein